MKVKVTYFKESGKYYSEGEYETAMPEEEMWNLVKDYRRNVVILGHAPGLSTNGSSFHVVLNPISDKGYPFMIPKDQA